jgi:hypothetical protein
MAGRPDVDGAELRDILAAIAALGSLSDDDDALAALATELDCPPVRLRRRLADLADAGLLAVSDGDRYAIAPDVLSAHLLWSSFFSERRRAAIRFERLWAAADDARRGSMCAALGGLAGSDVPDDHPIVALVAIDLRALAAHDAARALAHVQSLAPGVPQVAASVIDVALEHLPNDRFARERVLLAAAEVLQRTADITVGWPRQLRVAQALWAGRPTDAATKTMVEHLTSAYKRLPIGRGPHDGQILAVVQRTLADSTRQHLTRHRHQPGCAMTVAVGCQQLLTVTFDTSAISPEDGASRRPARRLPTRPPRPRATLPRLPASWSAGSSGSRRTSSSSEQLMR